MANFFLFDAALNWLVSLTLSSTQTEERPLSLPAARHKLPFSLSFSLPFSIFLSLSLYFPPLQRAGEWKIQRRENELERGGERTRVGEFDWPRGGGGGGGLAERRVINIGGKLSCEGGRGEREGGSPSVERVWVRLPFFGSQTFKEERWEFVSFLSNGGDERERKNASTLRDRLNEKNGDGFISFKWIECVQTKAMH